MKQFFIALCFVGIAGFFTPATVFCGGNKDNKSGNADSGTPINSRTTGTVNSAGDSQADLQPAAIVNLVKSEPITVKQLRTEVERMEMAAGQTMNQNERLQVLDVMINERLAIQAAERDRIAVTENEVNQQVQEVRNQIAQVLGRQPTDAEFAQAVDMDVPTFKETVRRQMTTQKYLMTKKDNLFQSIRIPTEEEIRSAYNLNKAQFVRPDTVRFSMIQVPYGADAASRTRAKTLADNLAREIGSSASKFDEVVVRGQSPNAGYQAGDGGYLPRNMQAAQITGQEFISTAFSLKQGEISKLRQKPKSMYDTPKRGCLR